MRLLFAAIAAAARPDCDCDASACEPGESNFRFAGRLLTTLTPHRCRAGATARSLFRFASVARGPRFAPGPVNLAPDCDG
jgi:hypothetical protein